MGHDHSWAQLPTSTGQAHIGLLTSAPGPTAAGIPESLGTGENLGWTIVLVFILH